MSWCLGRPSFVLPGDEQLTRVTLPSDSFTHPLGRIDGVSIRTLSPLALYQMRAALVRTGAFRSTTAQGRSRTAKLVQPYWRESRWACSSPSSVPTRRRPS